MIYFIQAGSTGLVKIGRANNIYARMKQGQTFSAQHLRLIGAIDESKFSEKEIHARFKKRHAHREWFYLSDEMREFISEHARDNPARTFREWLTYQEERDDPIGDFAADTRRNEDYYPKFTQPPKNSNAWDWYKFVKQRSRNEHDVIYAFIEAFKEWRSEARELLHPAISGTN